MRSPSRSPHPQAWHTLAVLMAVAASATLALALATSSSAPPAEAGSALPAPDAGDPLRLDHSHLLGHEAMPGPAPQTTGAEGA